MGWFSRKEKSLGEQGEDAAARALRKAGYTILERNVHLGRYEIDIIAREGDTTVFVEVKTRRDTSVFPAETNVDYGKRRRIARAAREYIAREDDSEMYYRFDIAAVTLPESGRAEVTLIRDAFQDARRGR